MPLTLVMAPDGRELFDRPGANGQRLARALSERLRRPVAIELASREETLEQRFFDGDFELLWAPFALRSRVEPGARVVLQAIRAGRPTHRAALLARAGEGWSMERLHRARAAWVEPLSSAGCILPRALVRSQNLDPEALFASQQHFGSYGAALRALVAGGADVTAVTTPTASEVSVRALLSRHLGDDASLLEPIAYTEPCPTEVLAISRALTVEQASTLAADLLQLPVRDPLLHALFEADGFAVEPLSAPHRVGPAPERARLAAPEPESLVPFRLLELGSLVLRVDEDSLCQDVWSGGPNGTGEYVRSLLGRPLSTIFGVDAGGQMVHLLEQARTATCQRLTIAVDVEGERRWLAAEATRMSTDEPSAAAALVVQDVTDERRRELEWARWSALRLSDPEPVLEVDEHGAITFSNPAACAAFPLHDEQHPLQSLLRDACACLGESHAPPPQVLSLGDRVFHINVLPVAQAARVRIRATDITEHVGRAGHGPSGLPESRAAAAATIAHELNNPLAYVDANLRFAVDQMAGFLDHPVAQKPGVQEALQAIREAHEGAQRLRSIVRGLGGASRVHQRTEKRSRTRRKEHRSEKLRVSDVQPVARVLVVDDEAAVARSIRRVLRGCRVELAGDGEEALALLAEDDDFDLILCDLMMPRVSGVRMYRRLSERQPHVAERVVFMTAGAVTEEARELLRELPHRWLQKPFDPGVVHQRVREALAARRDAEQDAEDEDTESAG